MRMGSKPIIRLDAIVQRKPEEARQNNDRTWIAKSPICVPTTTTAFNTTNKPLTATTAPPSSSQQRKPPVAGNIVSFVVAKRNAGKEVKILYKNANVNDANVVVLSKKTIQIPKTTSSSSCLPPSISMNIKPTDIPTIDSKRNEKSDIKILDVRTEKPDGIIITANKSDPQPAKSPVNGIAAKKTMLSKCILVSQQNDGGHKNATRPPTMTSKAEYRELFAALFKIPDTALVARVMAAINNAPSPSSDCNKQPPTSSSQSVVMCSKCSKSSSVVAIATQTAAVAVTQKTTAHTQTMESDFRHARDANPPRMQRKRRRREPHAVKAEADSINVDVVISDVKNPSSTFTVPIKVSRTESTSATSESTTESSAVPAVKIQPKPALFDTTPNLSSVLKDESTFFGVNQFLFNPFGDFVDHEESLHFVNDIAAKLDRSNDRRSRVKARIRQEFLDMLEYGDDGLLPIHMAILNGEELRLKRLVKICTVLNPPIDLNALIGKDRDENDDELTNSVLHFAVASERPNASIVRHLLDNGANPLLCNRHEDSVLHYAVKHTEDASIFAALLDHICANADASTIYAALSATNNDGLALVHLIVKSRKVPFMELLLSAIDRLAAAAGGIVGPVEQHNSVSTQDLQHRIESFQTLAKQGAHRPLAEKCAVLNKPENCTGRTALLRAIVQNDCDRMVLLLLAHNADPRIADFAGFDCLQASALDEEKALDLGMYIQLAANLLQSLEGQRARPIRNTYARPPNGGQQPNNEPAASGEAARPTLRISCVDQAILMEETQRPKRPYKRRANGPAGAELDAAHAERRSRKQ